MSHYFSIFCSNTDNSGGNKLFISSSSSDVAWVTENLISVLEEHKISYQLGGPIDPTTADKVYDSLQVLLVVLSENYPTTVNVCRKGRKMSAPRKLGKGDSLLIIVSIDKVRKGRLSDLACLGKQILLEFEGNRKKDWAKKLLQAMPGEKVVSR